MSFDLAPFQGANRRVMRGRLVRVMVGVLVLVSVGIGLAYGLEAVDNFGGRERNIELSALGQGF